VDCTDRSRAECQPTILSTDEALTLTLLGRDVYWAKQAKLTLERTILRTSLDSGQTAPLPLPQNVPDPSAILSTTYLLHDAQRVYSVSIECCSGPDNAILDYRVADSSWREVDLQQIGTPHAAVMLPEGVVVAFAAPLFFYSYPVDATTAFRWVDTSSTQNPRAAAWISSDGTTLFATLVDGAPSATKTTQIVRFDDHVPTVLATVPTQTVYQANSLTVDDASVYFAARATIIAVDKKTPGPPRTVFDASPNLPRYLQVDRSFVYWVDDTGLRAVPKTGGAALQLARFPPFTSPDAGGSETVHDAAQTDDYIVLAGAEGLEKIHK
jgi:hypothetical protein